LTQLATRKAEMGKADRAWRGSKSRNIERNYVCENTLGYCRHP